MAPSVTMLESAAYGRMRQENPSEFVPKSVFFTRDSGSKSDRANSFWVKAALVYESITGHHVNDATMPVAHWLLLSLANKCCSPTDASATGVVPLEKTTQLPDEGSDENKKMIDGIFLVVGFLSRLKKAMGEGGKSNSRDAVDESFKSTHMQDIVTDVIKLENQLQLPLKHLLVVVGRVKQAVEGTLSAVKGILSTVKDTPSTVKDTLLSAVNATLRAEFTRLKEHLEKYELEFKPNNFLEVVHCFCWYYSPFFKKDIQFKNVAAGDTKMEELTLDFLFKKDSEFKNVAADATKMEELTLLDCLHASLVPLPPSPEGAETGGDAGGKTFRMPTARELSRSGVRFDAGKDGRAVVKFNERPSSLLLPALVYDFKLATVARNLLALEYEKQSKPVTRYFQMMNELVVEVADVRILRRAGAVRGGSRGAHEVHELIKKIDGHATYPSVFIAMDLQIEKVKRFHDMRMKSFLVRYRPGVIWASSVAAVSVVAIIVARKKRA